jgi:hypothetical protein
LFSSFISSPYCQDLTTEHTEKIVNIDGLVKSPKTPSPLMGEGWGEGEKGFISND